MPNEIWEGSGGFLRKNGCCALAWVQVEGVLVCWLPSLIRILKHPGRKSGPTDSCMRIIDNAYNTPVGPGSRTGRSTSLID
jgi:hypothetical protein